MGEVVVWDSLTLLSSFKLSYLCHILCVLLSCPAHARGISPFPPPPKKPTVSQQETLNNKYMYDWHISFFFSSLQSIFQVNGSYSLSPMSKLHQACKVCTNKC